MNNLFSLNPNQIKMLYNSLTFHKSKDKIDMVLEPLQSMIQISLLSVSPIGTKITIQENILSLQHPNIIQPFNRWYHSDKKDDLYFLFQVIKRFTKWYNPKLNKKSILNEKFYDIIINMSLKGLDNLLKTYNSSDNNAIIQVIHMYKNLLENPDVTEDKNHNEKINIDEVFGKIIQVYDSDLLRLIESSLIIIEKEENINYVSNYIAGLNSNMIKSNKLVQNWIKINMLL
jgi:hypothetical protein